ncbi:MAG: FAD-dependent oxidoreductase [Pseudomonadota bacterium]
MYKIVVVGRGLIGSAAARHLAESSDGIACVGPDEPLTREGHTGVFASHYDEGRMTRNVDPEREWAITARCSIARYRDIESRSGIPFYTPVGYLGLGIGPIGKRYNARCASTGEAEGAAVERLNAEEVRARFPYLAVPEDVDGLVELGGAGHISPRRLVQAQTRLAESAGATVVLQAARTVRVVASGVEVELWDGSTLMAERALVATGAFTDCCGLSAVDLGLKVYGRTTVLVRIEGDAAAVLRDMPTMIDTAIGAYILPPIHYPDGHRYLKLGVGSEDNPQFAELGDLQQWFKSDGSEPERALFSSHLKSRFPVLKACAHWHTDTCAVTRTATGLPIVDVMHEGRIAVAVGGCGKGAKGSDEWGRIAAGVVRGAPWSSEVPRAKLALGSRPQQR